MKTKKIGLEHKGKTIEINCRDCNILQKMRGLMFRKRESAPVLLFEFSDDKYISFHSFFVFFPFVMVWCDNQNKIIECREIFPWNWRIKTTKHFSKVIEIPVNEKNSKILSRLHEILVDERKI